jgi:hypothetical protein
VPESDTSTLEALLEPLEDSTRAEFLAELRRLSLHQNDDELFKLLKILNLYAAFYQTIPDAIRAVHDKAIARIETLLESGSGAKSEGRIDSLAKELIDAAKELRGACPPPFEEFRANIECLQGNVGQINRYGRELIVELQKNAAQSRRGRTPDGTLLLTSLCSATLGAVVIYAVLRLFHL